MNKKARNTRIMELRRTSVPVKTIAERYQISEPRVYQIIKEMEQEDVIQIAADQGGPRVELGEVEQTDYDTLGDKVAILIVGFIMAVGLIIVLGEQFVW